MTENKLLVAADMPYSMDDSVSRIPLGVTVRSTDNNDGWIISSSVCGYSFTHLWGHADPVLTITLEGDKYDGRILGPCGK